MDDNLGPDVRLALAAIAAELGVDPDSLPAGVGAILHAFGAARYGEGARDWLVTFAKRQRTNRGFPRVLRTVRDDDKTPVIGKHGRRRRDDDGDDGGGSAA